MPNDATFEIMAGLASKEAAISLIAPPTWNIDDMDPRFCMVNLMFTGMYCLKSSKTIDPGRPGMIYLDGEPAGPPLIPPLMPMFGQMVGIHARKYLKEYNRAYAVRFAGAFDTDGLEIPEFTFTLTTLPKHVPGEKWAEHDSIVLDAARETAVLMKNENHALPLGPGNVVNPFGSGAVVFRPGCLGAGKINPRYFIQVKEGVERYSSLRMNEELYNFYTNEQNCLPDEEMLKRARQQSDTAVVFLSRTSSEAHDNLPVKGQYYLTDEERSLIEGVARAFHKTVAVLNVAYPIETGWMKLVDAVLLVGLPGMAGGRALAEILEGTVNPSGKLACTWAEDYFDYPASQNFLTLPMIRQKYPGANYVTTVYEEGLYVGYRYFDTFGKAPAFRFGHGLSYTQFQMEGKTEGFSAEISVKNTGDIPGKEVIQIYAGLPCGKLEQPKRRLVAFAKTKELSPGGEQKLYLEIKLESLRSFEEEAGAWILEAGEILFYLGENVIGSVIIPETRTLKKAGARIPAPIKVKELSIYDPEGTYPEGKDTKACNGDTLPLEVPRTWTELVPELPKPDHLVTFPEVAAKKESAESFVGQMSDEELARLTVGGKTGWGVEDNGFAGTLFNRGALEKYKLPDYFFSDGNNGVNLNEPNIGFPVSATMCASWNEELLYQEGKAIAQEARAMGMHCILAPALNLQRNILCGRHTEYFSEDPLLAGRMAGQQCRGLEENGVSASMKHFFANNAETMRNLNHSIMTERTARELYLAAFEYAFDVKMPDTVMTGYNAANGMYCCDDPALLKGILREEMGFEGYIMTDWNGYGDQGMEGLVRAGISWIAPGSPDDTFAAPIRAALEKGTLKRGLLQQNLVRLVEVLSKTQ